MPFSLTWAGVPFNLDTDESRNWIDRFLPLEDARITVPDRPWPGPALLAVTRPFRQPHRPKLRLGEFFYPSGASRWSEAHLLAAESQYDQIAGKVGTSQPFVIQQGGVTVQTNLYLLPPRPLAKFGANPGLYLCSLVDERFFWQYQNAGSVHVSDGTMWSALIGDLCGALGIGVPVTVSPDYGQPQPLSDFDSEYENAAVLLDAALANVGLTLVRNLDGTYAAVTPAASKTTAAANKSGSLLAGGEFDSGFGAILPQSVQVCFPKRLICPSCVPPNPWVNAKQAHVPYSRNLGDFWTTTVTLAQCGYAYTGFPYSQTFHSQAEAWVNETSDTTPVNVTQLQTLAKDLARTYYDAQVEGLDAAYPLIVGWSPEGLHDVTWSWHRDACSTRVQRLPYNFWTDVSYLHHFPAPTSGPGASSSSSSSGSGSVAPATPECIRILDDVDVECVDGVIQTTKTYKFYYPQTGQVAWTPCENPQ